MLLVSRPTWKYHESLPGDGWKDVHLGVGIGYIGVVDVVLAVVVMLAVVDVGIVVDVGVVVVLVLVVLGNVVALGNLVTLVVGNQSILDDGGLKM